MVSNPEPVEHGSMLQLPRGPFAPAWPFSLRINGEMRSLLLEPRGTLLDALRETLKLTGTNKGCDRERGLPRDRPTGAQPPHHVRQIAVAAQVRPAEGRSALFIISTAGPHEH